ncbi:MAG: conjugal transfer protein TraG [Phenylobacterium sp.]|uniref:type IV secretory system conjugative DNA transfer family protein n=1 Tax=Phenylobacterium sp. TaxID=1871053 RepID=UPI0025ED8864|nr:type IV secretory system conjugative DNA transfer family protein [Phenylobacterium sp.]MBA4013256.1 conjugal transfer protein TraG [Phenylobacterium sp.]
MRVIAYGWLVFDLLVGFVCGSTAGLAGATILGWFGHDLSELGRQLVAYATGALGAGVAFQRRRVETAAARSSDVHGSAAFGEEEKERRRLSSQDGLIVGRAQRGWLLRYGGPAHLVTIAPTRSGKGVGAIIPNLLTTPRPVICVDPKGENARIAAHARRAFGPVHVLDPFGVSGQASAAFNPLVNLDADNLDIADDAALIADALVYDPPHQVGEAHWNEEAKALIAGVIMYVIATAPPHGRTLNRVREMLTTAPESFEAELKRMQASPAAGGLVARAANRHLGKSDREAAGVLSAAQRHTHFLDSPRLRQSLATSDFAFADLRAGGGSVFLVLPPERLATYSRWLRLLVSLALHDLARGGRGANEGRSVLFLLDEFAALGRLEPVERAFALMAGYGVQLWAILQDLHQLRGLYGAQAGTFLSNAEIIQIFNVADIETASWVSKMAGVMTEHYTTAGTSVSQTFHQPFATHGESTSEHFVARPLMTPDEILHMRSDRLLLLRPGKAVLAPWKVRHYADAEFRGLFDP